MMKKLIIGVIGLLMIISMTEIGLGISCSTGTCENLYGEEDCPETKRYAIYPAFHDFEVIKGGWKYMSDIDVLNDASTYAIEDGNRFYRLNVSEEVSVKYGEKKNQVEALFFSARFFDDTITKFSYSNYEVLVNPSDDEVTYTIEKDGQKVTETYSVSIQNDKWYRFNIINFKKQSWILDVNILDNDISILSKDIDYSEFKDVDDRLFTDEESRYFGLIDKNYGEFLGRKVFSHSNFVITLPEGGVVDFDNLTFEHRSNVYAQDFKHRRDFEAVAVLEAYNDYGPLPRPGHPIVYKKIGTCGNKQYYERTYEFTRTEDLPEEIQEKMDSRIAENEPIETDDGSVIEEPEEEDKSTFQKVVDGVWNFFGGLI